MVMVSLFQVSISEGCRQEPPASGLETTDRFQEGGFGIREIVGIN